jgi:hypothetical protein
MKGADSKTKAREPIGQILKKLTGQKEGPAVYWTNQIKRAHRTEENKWDELIGQGCKLESPNVQNFKEARNRF